MKWLKLESAIYQNRKIKQIESLPDGYEIFSIWIKLLCLASIINDDGLVYFTKDIPYKAETLAVEFGNDAKIIENALTVFRLFGMIEYEGEYIIIKNWAEYQSNETEDKTREQTRSRVQKYRERQSAARDDEQNVNVTQNSVTSNAPCNVTSNADVTPCNGAEEEREEEEEKDISLSLSPRASAADTETEKPLLADGEREKLVALMGEELLSVYVANMRAYIRDGGKVRNPCAMIEKFWREDAKKSGKKSSGPPGSRKREKIIGGSFDTDEFFAGALRRSYGDDPKNAGRMDMSHGKIASLDDHKQEASAE